jgi:exodeoxyribonuclease-3
MTQKKLRIASWNVNGIRAVSQKGFVEWLNTGEFDVIGVQEIKAFEEQFPDALQKHPDYDIYVNSAKRPGYSGVALFVKKSLNLLNYSLLNQPEYDDEGRVQVAEFEDFFLFNCYLPNGARDHSRVPYKLACSQATLELAKDLEKEYNKPVIMCGDFNTAHHAIDLKNPKTNTKTTGFLPIEREWMDSFLAEGFVDIFRDHHKDEPDHYTWWSYRNDCRGRNIGWRIDYFMVSETLKNDILDSSILPQVLGSDHCPIAIEVLTK